MTQSDRTRWDQRYRDAKQRLDAGPNALLVRHVPAARPGERALELACGLGLNALWLAAQGYCVDALDISYQGLRRAHAEMRRRSLVGVNFVVADLDHFVLPPRAYDLVIVFRYLDRRLFPVIRSRVRPGGMVVYQTLNVRAHTERRPINPDHMLALGELRGHFPGWTVLEAGESGHLSSFVGRKPGEA